MRRAHFCFYLATSVSLCSPGWRWIHSSFRKTEICRYKHHKRQFRFEYKLVSLPLQIRNKETKKKKTQSFCRRPHLFHTFTGAILPLKSPSLGFPETPPFSLELWGSSWPSWRPADPSAFTSRFNCVAAGSLCLVRFGLLWFLRHDT